MEPREFLTALWGDPPPGVVLVWTLPKQESSWHTRFDGVNRDAEDHRGDDVYTGVGIASRELNHFTTKNKLTEEEVTGLAGLWADIDCDHPVHRKNNLPPSMEHALETIEEAHFEPSMLVDSGHGLQAWWLFRRPWIFESPEDHELGRRASQWWHHHIQGLYTARGWTTDSVFNLDRVMRLPGTWNNRDPREPKPVSIITENERRFDPQEFLDLAPEDFQTSLPPLGREKAGRRRGPARRRTHAGGKNTLELNPEAEPQLLRLETLLKNDHRFRRSWEQDRKDLPDQSPSAYDMSLATIAIQAGWPDQEVVNLLICWRRKHEHDLKLRENYYRVTIDKAKEPLRMAQAQERLNETMIQPPDDEAEVLKDNLTTLFGVEITRIVKYLGDPPIYYMYTIQGNITLGKIANIISQNLFRGMVAAATGVMIPSVNRRVWEQRVQAMLLACEEIEVGDASHPAQETQVWISEYLLEKPPRGEYEWEKAAEVKQPFIDGNQVCIFLEDLRRWLDLTTGEKLTAHAMGQRLRQCNAEPDQVNVHIGRVRTTRVCWRLPEHYTLPGFGEKDESPDDESPDDESPDDEPPEDEPPEDEQ